MEIGQLLVRKKTYDEETSMKVQDITAEKWIDGRRARS
jgi:hypothetical protein